MRLGQEVQPRLHAEEPKVLNGQAILAGVVVLAKGVADMLLHVVVDMAVAEDIAAAVVVAAASMAAVALAAAVTVVADIVNCQTLLSYLILLT